MAQRQGLEQDGQGGFRLTPQAYRLFQGKLLQRIFSHLQPSRTGRHNARVEGDGAVELPSTKEYQFGDSIANIDTPQSILNALRNRPDERPVRLRATDMEVHQTRNNPKCATVVVMDEALMRFPASFSQRSVAERVTVWYTVPFFLQQLASRGALDQHDLSSLRWLLYGGEAYSPAALDALLHQLHADVAISNVYGPAEVNQCTVWSFTRDELDMTAADVPLGDAWGGARLAVVDDDGEPVVEGEAGELLVAATTAMAGYWRQPELTDRTVRTLTYLVGDDVKALAAILPL
jgi:hypothetical protein